MSLQTGGGGRGPPPPRAGAAPPGTRRRPRRGRGLHEVEVGLTGQPQGVLDAHDPHLLAVRTDQADLGHADALVDARLYGYEFSSGSTMFPVATRRGGPVIPRRRAPRRRARGGGPVSFRTGGGAGAGPRHEPPPPPRGGRRARTPP